MKSFVDLGKEIKSIEDSICLIKNNLENLDKEKKNLLSGLEKKELELYQKSVYLCHMKEIFRLAKIQFSRLRHSPERTLTLADIQELDKWIGRAKAEDGIKDIRNALAELSKYSPSEIKSNLYALVQKIIIEGPFNKEKTHG